MASSLLIHRLLLIIAGAFLANNLTHAQVIALLQPATPIEGVCTPSAIHVLFPVHENQHIAIYPGGPDSLEALLVEQLSDLADFTTIKAELTVQCIINCKGEVVFCLVGTDIGSPALNAAIESAFRSTSGWTPGRIGEQAVDSARHVRLKLKKGKLSVLGDA